jgi:hypothetical protein
VSGEPLHALRQRAVEILRGIIFVMQMHLGLAAGGATQVRERTHNVRIVLLDRVEKRVLRRLPVRVPKLARQLREIPPPGRHPCQRLLLVRVVKRLEVIANREHHVTDAKDVFVKAMPPQPSGEPDVEGFEHFRGNRGRAKWRTAHFRSIAYPKPHARAAVRTSAPQS